ncbi:Golgi apparatus membrane protein TVP15 [Metarhizium album ARSEF 1941]|uniref:Golgi apparatus membrane protein TVP15 n=1 Tax=Metarhizium album (strain ARSEF 1941) TaxID=1081103 RepID=A0A0B2WXE9_METAS|nr:Golgi apparatus membrane protein TVP15 [Metarhizium album ARSEF 1941]KHN98102.1 Golgi apparatus membrane protein TVP15 [Metarhizium album ARSEF 1941]
MELSDILYVSHGKERMALSISTATDVSVISICSRIVNLVVAVITVLGGIAQIFNFQLQAIILGAYMIVFGLAIALLEFQIPPQVSRYANFLFSFIGRGIFYILLGGLLFGKGVLPNIAGGIVCIFGVGYVALEFIPSIEPPSNMREADAGWGAEQV